MHQEHKFSYYQSGGRGKIYLCLREGSWEEKEPRPVVPRGQRFDKYDAYASSIIGVCLNEDGSVKAINSRYIWRVGGTDHDFTKKEVMSLLGDKACEVLRQKKLFLGNILKRGSCTGVLPSPLTRLIHFTK